MVVFHTQKYTWKFFDFMFIYILCWNFKHRGEVKEVWKVCNCPIYTKIFKIKGIEISQGCVLINKT